MGQTISCFRGCRHPTITWSQLKSPSTIFFRLLLHTSPPTRTLLVSPSLRPPRYPPFPPSSSYVSTLPSAPPPTSPLPSHLPSPISHLSIPPFPLLSHRFNFSHLLQHPLPTSRSTTSTPPSFTRKSPDYDTCGEVRSPASSSQPADSQPASPLLILTKRF